MAANLVLEWQDGGQRDDKMVARRVCKMTAQSVSRCWPEARRYGGQEVGRWWPVEWQDGGQRDCKMAGRELARWRWKGRYGRENWTEEMACLKMEFLFFPEGFSCI